MNAEKLKNKENQIIEYITQYCDEELNEEYKELSIKLIKKIAAMENTPMTRGQIDIWACGTIYTIAQINFLFDEETLPYKSPEDICDYFGTKYTTGSQKANKIRKLFELKVFDDEFSTEFMKSKKPLDLDHEIPYTKSITDKSLQTYIDHLYLKNTAKIVEQLADTLSDDDSSEPPE